MMADQEATNVNDRSSLNTEDQLMQNVHATSQEDPEIAGLALRRLDDYLRDSLGDPDSQVAVFGIASHMLLRIAVRLHEQIECVLASAADPIEHCEVLTRAIDSLLRVCRQIDRFGRLRMLLTDARRALNSPSAH